MVIDESERRQQAGDWISLLENNIAAGILGYLFRAKGRSSGLHLKGRIHSAVRFHGLNVGVKSFIFMEVIPED